MKKLLLCFLFSGCLLTAPEAILRWHGMIIGNGGDFGSGTLLGDGYYITAQHVVGDDPRIWVITNAKIDSNVTVVYKDEEIAILSTRFFLNTSKLSVAKDLTLGEELYWIQQFPVTRDDSLAIHFYLMSGHVSRISGNQFFLDTPFYQGVSGAGIFNRRAELVGVAQSYMFYSSPRQNAMYGVFSRIQLNNLNRNFFQEE